MRMAIDLEHPTNMNICVDVKKQRKKIHAAVAAVAAVAAKRSISLMTFCSFF